jgi:hypothetical protein
MKSAGDGQQWLQLNAACGITQPKKGWVGLHSLRLGALDLKLLSRGMAQIGSMAESRSSLDSDSDSD